MIIILVGASGSGKSRLMNFAIRKLDFNLPLWYTTREPREDQSDSVYTFLSPLEFLEKQKDHTIENVNVLYGSLYGTSFPDYKNTNYISIMDVEGAWKAKRKYGKYMKAIFIDCSEEERAYRMLMRGDTQEQVYYRLAEDRSKFRDVFHHTEYKITSGTPQEDNGEFIDILKDVYNE